MSESSETPPEVAPSAPPQAAPIESQGVALLPPLRREALLPTERARGLGTVAIVCTMAGVASGLALATTLMAMQVADSMSARGCPYQQREIEVMTVDAHPRRAFLGVLFAFEHGVAEIDQVYPGTPAAALDLRVGDHVLTIDGADIHTLVDLRNVIYDWQAGAMTTLSVERGGHVTIVHPTLAVWPTSPPR